MWWRWVPPFGALVMSVGMASAYTHSEIPATAIPTVKCVYDLLKASPAVQSADVYVIDDVRSAVEFRFNGKDSKIIIADLMLLAGSPSKAYDMTYDIKIARNEPQAAGWESTGFISSLMVSSKCRVTPAFDDLIPGPEPRADWQQIDPSTLSPSAVPSPH